MENIFKWKEYLLGIDSSDGIDRSCKIYWEIIDWVVCINHIEYTDWLEDVVSQSKRLFPTRVF